MTSSIEPTPQERLAASRKAILRNMNADGGSPAPDDRRIGLAGVPDGTDHQPARGMWHTLGRTARVWWQHHPAQLALDVAKPLLGKYAHEKPFQLLGAAAAVGAAVVLLRPWRLVSLTGLAVTALKSSQVSGLVLSLLSTPSESPTSANDN